MTKLLTDYTQHAPTKHLDTYWDLLKSTIRDRTQTLSIAIHKQIRKKKYIIEQAITLAKHRDEHDPHILTLEEELDKYNHYMYQGAQIRSKPNLVLDETPNKHFLTVEQNIQRDRRIKKIVRLDGKETMDSLEINQAFQKFYCDLYTEAADVHGTPDVFLNYARRLTDHDKETVEQPLTLGNIKQALFSFQPSKSPGPDGLTAEFYQKFFHILGPLFLKVINEAFIKGELPHSMNESYITLISKNNTDKTQVKNYRPISLLNTDYKTLTKALTLKIKPFMHLLVHEDQQCSVPNRNINTHCHFLRDMIQYAHDKDAQTAILSIDQEKAFDRVSHKFLHQVLERNNLGKYFTNWIKIIYKKPSSKIIINHSLTESFLLTRSVRQGCPISPILYVLVLETALGKIRQDDDIKGSHIPIGGERKLIAYADDTVFFPSDLPSIKKILDTFASFGIHSGAKVNVDKSKIMGIGNWERKTDFPFTFTQVTELKIYGIFYQCRPTHTNDRMWTDTVTKLKNNLERYRYRTTTIFGRATIINTCIIPKLIYICNILDPPAHKITETYIAFRRFIFKNTMHAIQDKTLIQDKRRGGISLQDLKTKIQALRLKFIGDIITRPKIFPLPHYYIGTYISKFIKIDNRFPHFCGELPPFYKRCVDLFQNHNDVIFLPTKGIYNNLILAQEPPLQLRIKVGKKYFITDYSEIFNDLHNTQITPKAREITYRLLFNITPLRTNCKLCTTKSEETEKHIFYTCPTIQLAIANLEQIIKQHTATTPDMYKTIMLNILPHTNKHTKLKIFSTLGTFRETVWQCRNKAKHEHYSYNPNTILTIFRHKSQKL
jgi:hypothetical protein